MVSSENLLIRKVNYLYFLSGCLKIRKNQFERATEGICEFEFNVAFVLWTHLIHLSIFLTSTIFFSCVSFTIHQTACPVPRHNFIFASGFLFQLKISKMWFNFYEDNWKISANSIKAEENRYLIYLSILLLPIISRKIWIWIQGRRLWKPKKENQRICKFFRKQFMNLKMPFARCH